MFKKRYFSAMLTTLVLSVMSLPITLDYSKDALMKQEIRSELTETQKDLKRTVTADSEKPKANSPEVAAVAKTNNKTTITQTVKPVSKTVIAKGNATRKHVSRGGTLRSKEVQLLSWDRVDKLFAISDVATVIDVATGMRIHVQRTYGHNHADVEALTVNDTETLKKIAGGSWNWTRRPVIVEIGGYRIAASITGMPHAGREDMPANLVVSNRSGGFGSGVNLDAIKGNGMDGHFDIHFYGSKTHGSNSVDVEHQAAILEAYKSGK